MSTTERITGRLPAIPPAAGGKAPGRWQTLAFAGALTVGAVLRLWQLAAKPDWQSWR